MKKFLLIFCLFVFLNIGYAQTKKYHGVTFYTETKVGDTPVVINGAGLRTKYFMDMYVVALYLKKKSTDAVKVITANEEMAMHIKITSSMVTCDRFKEAVTEGFANATQGKATKEDQKKFMGYLSESFSVGDKIYLDYIPEKGVKVTKNGEYKGLISGLDFKKALFSIWLGGEPAQESLKAELLGKD